MKYTVIKPDEIIDSLEEAWRGLQEKDSLYFSPYFSHKFVQAVSAVRKDVFVTIMEDGNKVIGFFPFQKNKWKQGLPAGGALSDLHGPLIDPEIEFSLDDLIKSSGLISWKFTHSHLVGKGDLPKTLTTAESHQMDLSRGFEAYQSDIGKKGSKLIKDSNYKYRKLCRLHGDVRFVPNVTEPGLLATLFEWKSNQYQESGLVDVFSFEWTRKLLHEIHAIQDQDFSGMLSALYVEEKPVAIHFGMKTKEAWNWWFPRHDTDYNNCSPGIVLRMKVAEYAASIGTNRIDLGVGGDDTYKPRLSTKRIPLASGVVELPSFYNSLIKQVDMLENGVRSSPFYRLLRYPGRIVKNIQRKRRFN